MNIKVIHSKSKNKIMCIEAKEDFVDCIFGFPTIPFGSILKLLGGKSFDGWVDNLYSSVKNLDKRWSTNSLSVLMDPGVAHQFDCPKQPLKVSMLEPLKYTFPHHRQSELLIQKQYSSYYLHLNLVDPRAPNGKKKEDAVGFVRDQHPML